MACPVYFIRSTFLLFPLSREKRKPWLAHNKLPILSSYKQPGTPASPRLVEPGAFLGASADSLRPDSHMAFLVFKSSKHGRTKGNGMRSLAHKIQTLPYAHF